MLKRSSAWCTHEPCFPLIAMKASMKSVSFNEANFTSETRHRPRHRATEPRLKRFNNGPTLGHNRPSHHPPQASSWPCSFLSSAKGASSANSYRRSTIGQGDTSLGFIALTNLPYKYVYCTRVLRTRLHWRVMRFRSTSPRSRESSRETTFYRLGARELKMGAVSTAHD